MLWCISARSIHWINELIAACMRNLGPLLFGRFVLVWSVLYFLAIYDYCAMVFGSEFISNVYVEGYGHPDVRTPPYNNYKGALASIAGSQMYIILTQK